MTQRFNSWWGIGLWIATGGLAEVIHEPIWPCGFQPPVGWKCQHDANGAVLGHDRIAGLILMVPHTLTNLSQVQAQMQLGLTETGVSLMLDGDLKPLGTGSVAGNYRGTFNGAPVVARGIGTASANGGGAYVIAVTTPEQFGDELRRAAETLAGSVTVSKADPAAVAQQFVGRWMNIGKNSQATLNIYADGTYSSGSESTYSGQFRDAGGNDTGRWGVMGQNQQRGRWTARGTREQGVFQLVSPTGEASTVEYRVHVENGRVYWNEYYIGGKLYGRAGR